MYNKHVSKYLNKGIILSILSFPILFYIQGQLWASVLLAIALAALSYFGLKEEDLENYMILLVLYLVIMIFLLLFMRWYTLPIYVIGIYSVYKIVKSIKIMKREGRLD